MKTIKTLTSFLLPVAVAASLQAQTASEDFESYSVGNDLSTPLGGGTGWNGSWVTATGGGTLTPSGVIANSSPLAVGADQYISVSLANAAGGNPMGIGRELTTVPTGTYMVSFLWRADAVGAGFNTSNDRFEFFSADSAADVHSASIGGADAAHTSPYLFGIFGANRGSATALDFAVYDPPSQGGNAAFNANYYYNLGSVATGGDGTTLSVTAGVTYDVAITVDQINQTWGLSVSDGTTTAYSTGMGWWGSSTQPFVAFGSRGDQNNEARSFSFDNVQVAAVPEPGSIALLTLGCMVLPFLPRRRHGITHNRF
jgi:hypothetical protein